MTSLDFQVGQILKCVSPIMTRDKKKVLMKMGENATIVRIISPDKYNPRGYLELHLARRKQYLWFSLDDQEGNLEEVKP